MNTAVRNSCLLYANVFGGESLAERIGRAEAAYALERCLNRMARSARSHGASTVHGLADGLVAHFQSPEKALLAARDMGERVRALLPMKGVQLSVRTGAVLLPEATFSLESAADLAMGIARLADPDSVLVSQAFRDALAPSLQRRLAPIDSAAHEDAGFLFMLTDTSPPTPAELRQGGDTLRKTLRISYRGQTWVVDEDKPSLHLGREPDCDIVLDHHLASRRHARIEMRSRVFYLIDSSTNGTRLFQRGSSEVCVRQSEQLLAEKGHIGCGYSAVDNISDAVAFAVVLEDPAADTPQAAYAGAVVPAQ